MQKLLFILFLLPATFCLGQNNPTPSGKYHEFDFWLGSWDVYATGDEKIIAHSDIETIIDSIGILENYSILGGNYKGKSLNKYNPFTKKWEQYWIDNSGLTLFLSGGIIEGKMVLDDLTTSDGKNGYNKISWEKLANGYVRQIWEISNDGGKTWTISFDGEYRPRKK